MAGLGGLHRRPRPPACGRGPKRGLQSPAIGRSRGGLTSKIHLACDGSGRPLAFVLTGGNTNDCTQFTAVMDAIRVPRTGSGRPRTRPDHVLGDKGYSSEAIRTWLRCRGISHTIPERKDQIANRARRRSLGGRPPAFARDVYKRRNVVERCFNRAADPAHPGRDLKQALIHLLSLETKATPAPPARHLVPTPASSFACCPDT